MGSEGKHPDVRAGTGVPYATQTDPPRVSTALNRGDLVNRFGYHKATEETGPIHQEIRGKFLEFAEWMNDLLPEGRAKSTALTELENCSMWTNKAIAEMAPIAYE